MKGEDIVNTLYKAMSGNTGKKIFELFEIARKMPAPRFYVTFDNARRFVSMLDRGLELPYNFKPHTVVYTIVDFERNVRGMDNYVFGIYDYYSDEDCEQALQELISGEMEVSYRNHVELDITRVKNLNYDSKGT
jgi:hypothetical protein